MNETRITVAGIEATVQRKSVKNLRVTVLPPDGAVRGRLLCLWYLTAVPPELQLQKETGLSHFRDSPLFQTC